MFSAYPVSRAKNAEPTVTNLIHAARSRLATGDGAGDGDPHRDTEILLAHATGITVTAQAANPNRRVPTAQAKAFMKLVNRRAQGEPIAYLTGRKEFWSLELTVTPAVLIPRPETELLVECALEFAARRDDGELRILDLGTGSGAVALALAAELPGCRITATDSSAAAITVARANYRRLLETARAEPGDGAPGDDGTRRRPRGPLSGGGDGLPRHPRSPLSGGGDCLPRHPRSPLSGGGDGGVGCRIGTVEFRVGNWFSALPAEEKFDLIVSNPPYIAPDDPHLRRGDLRFEPRAALASKRAGLADLARIIADAPAHLTPGGALLLEHGHTQAAEVRALMTQHNFATVKTHPDLAGHARVTGGLADWDSGA